MRTTTSTLFLVALASLMVSFTSAAGNNSHKMNGAVALSGGIHKGFIENNAAQGGLVKRKAKGGKAKGGKANGGKSKTGGKKTGGKKNKGKTPKTEPATSSVGGGLPLVGPATSGLLGGAGGATGGIPLVGNII